MFSVAHWCPTLWDPMEFSLSGTSVHGLSLGKNTGAGCHTLLQGICPTQGSNTGLLHCRQILYHLGHQGTSWILEWPAYPFFRGSSQTRNRTREVEVSKSIGMNGWFLFCFYVFFFFFSPINKTSFLFGLVGDRDRWKLSFLFHLVTATCGILVSYQGSDLCPLHWQCKPLTAGLPGKRQESCC